MKKTKFKIGQRVYYLGEIVTVISIEIRKHGYDDYLIQRDDGTKELVEEIFLENES